jgi:hypothetical protein
MGMKNGLIFAFALLALFGAASASLYVDSYTVTPSTLRPGEEGAITFSIRNVAASATESSVQVDDVQVYFSAPAGLEFKSKSPYIVGTIDASGAAVVSIPFRVLSTAQSGIFTTTFQISQKDKTELKTLNALIKVVNPPIISFSSDHQTVLSTDLINLTITNNGGLAGKATLSINDSSNFSFIGLTQVYLGDVSGTITVPVPLDSRKVNEGLSSIPFILSYQEEGGDLVVETRYMPVVVKKEKADVSFIQVDPIITNRDNTLTIKVRNKGRLLEDFRVILTDESVKAKDSQQISLGTLASGDEKEFSVPVFVSAQPGVKSTQFDLKWVEDDVEKEELLTVPIAISSDAEVGIYLDAKPTPLAVGGDFTLSATVSNLGSYKIANVVVALESNSAFDILNIQREQYIGNLDNDAFSTVQYKIRVKNTIAPGDYPMVFKVRYKDQSGLWIEKNVGATVSIRPASEGVQKDNGSGTMLLIGGIAVVAFGYWYFRMRKPKQPAK